VAEKVPLLISSLRFLRRHWLGSLLVLLLLALSSLPVLLPMRRAYLLARNRAALQVAARRVGLDCDLLLALARAESALDAGAVSCKGARGLTQVMPATGAEVAAESGMRSYNLFDPDDNALIGALYLKKMLKKFRGQEYLALAAYNAGPGNVENWLALGRGLPGPEVVETFAFAETRDYVARVLRFRREERAARIKGGAGQPVSRKVEKVTPGPLKAQRALREPSAMGDRPKRYAHTVRSGESLSGIAARFKVSVAQLTLLNRIGKPDWLMPGTLLALRPLPVAGGEKLIRQLIAGRSKARIVLTIYKEKRSLELSVAGAPLRSYQIALGSDALRDKIREGDGRTPEGEFFICQRLSKGRWGPSLGISYPNMEDARRGLLSGLLDRVQYQEIVSAIANGLRPPWNTPLGGAICIHGRGNARDWTAGCIALDDADASELFALIPLGSKVSIRP
jgi:Transglycosylase SLT domain/L,D-transpeptidase catalytic domain/LysM domain